jgi:hypothetical protein
MCNLSRSPSFGVLLVPGRQIGVHPGHHDCPEVHPDTVGVGCDEAVGGDDSFDHVGEYSDTRPAFHTNRHDAPVGATPEGPVSAHEAGRAAIARRLETQPAGRSTDRARCLGKIDGRGELHACSMNEHCHTVARRSRCDRGEV